MWVMGTAMKVARGMRRVEGMATAMARVMAIVTQGKGRRRRWRAAPR